ncbi:hypothetical protein [Thioflexithrix psekupsensis]|uniref:Phycocyanobilin:ferredoxin oxidoreductase n=1 Tax=Thioflexithrix psekupsensis TaxID=1570016 RepID=A0A251X5K5_9GAMM|nr:hypothetical protein [Thioflexithrix psekupsensis]OUD12635.1 hypothetical protein TPSD3_16290 [Thioflexithrix psekupsensis]
MINPDSLFKPMWDFLTAQNQWHIVDLPDWLLSVKGKSDTVLNSLLLQHHFGCQIRALHIINRKAEVILIMAYPLNAAHIPVLAVEYVAFQGQPYVAVTDLQWVNSNARLVQQLTDTLQESYQYYSQQLSLEQTIPDWACYFSPICLYSRPKQPSELAALIAAFETYWQQWTNHFLCHETGQITAAKELQLYQQHHIQHSPGKPFMNTIFGQAWTERYMQTFIYSCENNFL